MTGRIGVGTADTDLGDVRVRDTTKPAKIFLGGAGAVLDPGVADLLETIVHEPVEIEDVELQKLELLIVEDEDVYDEHVEVELD